MSLASELKVGFMDDLTLGGPEAQVASNVETVRREGEELGLRLNEVKCELISNTSQSTEPILKNFIHLPVNNTDLLGAPIKTGPAMDRALSKRCDDMSRAATRLKLIASHDAIILLTAVTS
jgi:hypothetical protein